MKLVYVASPFTSKSRNKTEKRLLEMFREAAVTEVAARLTVKYGKDYALDLPITSSYAMEKYEPKKLKGDFSFWAKRDLFMVREKCDEVWVITLPGWNESIGVTAEIKCAQQYGKPVKYVDPDTLKITIKEPKKVSA